MTNGHTPHRRGSLRVHAALRRSVTRRGSIGRARERTTRGANRLCGDDREELPGEACCCAGSQLLDSSRAQVRAAGADRHKHAERADAEEFHEEAGTLCEVAVAVDLARPEVANALPTPVVLHKEELDDAGICAKHDDAVWLRESHSVRGVRKGPIPARRPDDLSGGPYHLCEDVVHLGEVREPRWDLAAHQGQRAPAVAAEHGRYESRVGGVSRGLLDASEGPAQTDHRRDDEPNVTTDAAGIVPGRHPAAPGQCADPAAHPRAVQAGEGEAVELRQRQQSVTDQANKDGTITRASWAVAVCALTAAGAGRTRRRAGCLGRDCIGERRSRSSAAVNNVCFVCVEACADWLIVHERGHARDGASGRNREPGRVLRS